MKSPLLRFAFVSLAIALGGCSGESLDTSTSTTSGASSGAKSTADSSGSGGSSSGATGTGGGGGHDALSSLDAILAELRADLDAGMLAESQAHGWPVEVEHGMLFVSTDPALTLLAGDHDAWAGTSMHADQGFSWLVIEPPDGEHYKFTDKTTFTSDPWSRAYTYDDNGEMSLARPEGAHLERHFGVGDTAMQPRTVRVWLPASQPTHTLYAHDGQNLFDPSAAYGGWHLQDAAPDGMLIVGIDNTPARMDEYTQSKDVIEGQTMGGKADEYADFIQHTVRPLVRMHYGEAGPIGTLGSSLGGLVAFVIADRYPGEYAFAGSMSGTMGWGSIGVGIHDETVMQLYEQHGLEAPTLYLDSGGSGDTCADSDGDGVDDDDPTDQDNYCENVQMVSTLTGLGYVEETNLFYWYEPGAQHDEADWAARVFRPLDVFAAL